MADLSGTTGTWAIDPTHTTIGFSVRHAMVAKVRGRFTDFAGTFTLDGANPAASSAEIVIQTASIDTANADRDAQELIVTTDMRERKGIMDDRADAFLCLPGGIGTLEELMEVWTSRHLRMHEKPVVVLDPWDDFALLREQVKHWRDMGFVHEHAVEQLVWTKTIDEAFAALGIEKVKI